MSEFEHPKEMNHRQLDAEDRLRTETMLHLRKYARRVKDVGIAHVRAQFALNPNADPEVVAKEALAHASQGMFLSSPQKAVEGAAARSAK